MTAEIAIMNKYGVSLAADSAVTVSKGKVYNSANKLFTLSKFHPVGIMVYGNAELMGVPWESIIKIYRKILHTRKHSTLDEYAKDFMSFLDSPNPLFDVNQQKRYFISSVTEYFTQVILNDINNKLLEISKSGRGLTKKDIRIVLNKVINDIHHKLTSKSTLDHLPKDFGDSLITDYAKEIDEITIKIFEKLPILPTHKRQLRQIACCLFIKDYFHPNRSGVVIAGFGEDEVFPVIKSYVVECIVRNRLKYQYDSSMSGKIDHDNNATIIPFAQSEMVHTFMRGIDPEYKKFISSYIGILLNEYPKSVIGGIKKFSDKRKIEIENKLKDISKKLVTDFNESLNKVDASHISPVINAVAALPKDELASMAESLVNITSFKRRVSLEMETVGGPIDVAVISKGDGFVWIKRKHYFKADSNFHFLSNYFRDPTM